MRVAANGSSRFRLASPTTAALLGGLTLALMAVDVALSVATHDLSASSNGALYAIMLMFGSVGVVVTRRQPHNVLGWLLIGVALFQQIYILASLYVAIDYGSHRAALPLGLAAVWFENAFWDLGMIIGLPGLLLFPDGRPASRRWSLTLGGYVAVAVLVLASQCFTSSVLATWVTSHQIHIARNGQLTGHPPAGAAMKFLGSGLAVLALVPFWLSWVVHQLRAYRRSTGDLRQQLKWFTAGASVMVVGVVINIVLGGVSSSALADAVMTAGTYAVVAFPLSLGLGILKYRLYEVDRLISRTVSYALITGLVVGAYVGVITLTTKVLDFSSPVAVAASTLVAAGLFSPVRGQVQRVVDRRFNRARHDAEAMLAAFRARVRDAVDLATVQSELVDAVHGAFEPTHVGLWIRSAGTDGRRR